MLEKLRFYHCLQLNLTKKKNEKPPRTVKFAGDGVGGVSRGEGEGPETFQTQKGTIF